MEFIGFYKQAMIESYIEAVDLWSFDGESGKYMLAVMECIDMNIRSFYCNLYNQLHDLGSI